METYFKLKLLKEFIVPAAFFIGLILIFFIWCVASVIYETIYHSNFFTKKRIKEKIKVLEDQGFVKILLDDEEAYVPKELAEQEDDYISEYNLKIFYLKNIDLYSWEQIKRGKR